MEDLPQWCFGMLLYVNVKQIRSVLFVVIVVFVVVVVPNMVTLPQNYTEQKSDARQRKLKIFQLIRMVRLGELHCIGLEIFCPDDRSPEK